MAGYDDFVQLNYKPKTTDLVATFHVKVPSWQKDTTALGAVASESSVGTWAAVKALHYKHVQKVAAKVYEAKKIAPRNYWVKIAYPEEHFEPGNMSQIFASIAGNVFGMKAVDSLRLQDIQYTKKLIKSFPGPQFGIHGVRKIFNEKKRPLMLSVAKPKVGMTTAEHARVGWQIWTGGLDLLKDDENLSNQWFNPFQRRVQTCLQLRDKAEKLTGDKKSYLINVTAPTVQEMEKRAKFVAKQGGEYVMIDICTGGWMAVSSLREICQDLGLAIHAHRAFHGAFTRIPAHGFSMLNLAKSVRLLGVDNLHIGTAGVGKLVGGAQEVKNIQEQITAKTAKANAQEHSLGQNWYGTKPVFPVSSGGLHPILVEDVLNRMGTNIMLQIGGGVHGHPNGSYAGAKAMREAVEAYMDGVHVDDAAKTSKELRQALEYWGHTRPR
ncbi:type III ribulose-bisphosphate carboxylase [Candidatus Woesearchaeota archaeon]|nr:type III ribulose-bisphosphate carboxylase [Candidatus Woesearchaeota archaeon]